MKKILAMLIACIVLTSLASCVSVSEITSLEVIGFETEYAQGQSYDNNFSIIADGKLIEVNDTIIKNNTVSITGFNTNPEFGSNEKAKTLTAIVTYQGLSVSVKYIVLKSTVVQSYDQLITALSNSGNIYLDTNEIIINAPLIIKSNTKLIGKIGTGTTIKMNDSEDSIFKKFVEKWGTTKSNQTTGDINLFEIQNQSNIYIENINANGTFDGEYTEGLGDDGDIARHCFNCLSSNSLYFKNINIQEFGKSGINLNGSSATVENSTIKGSGWSNINVDYGANRKETSLSRTASLVILGSMDMGDSRDGDVWVDFKVDWINGITVITVPETFKSGSHLSEPNGIRWDIK